MSKKLPVRVKNELKFRELTVESKTLIADIFYRIVFTSPGLSDFASHGFDDHVKVFFPAAGAKLALPTVSEEGIVWQDGYRPQARDYTPLDFSQEKNSLTLDFYIHEHGVASQWAAGAKPGDSLVIGGPRGSLVIPTDYAWQLYLCDESGLPAVYRRLQELPASPRIEVLVSSEQARGQEYLAPFSGVNIRWLTPDNLQASLDSLPLPDEDYFIWLTGEANEVKRLSDYFLTVRQVDADLLRALAYWHKK